MVIQGGGRVGYARVVINLRSVAERVSMQPGVFGIVNAGQVMTILGAFAVEVRRRGTAEGLGILAAFVERAAQPDPHLLQTLRPPAPPIVPQEMPRRPALSKNPNGPRPRPKKR